MGRYGSLNHNIYVTVGPSPHAVYALTMLRMRAVCCAPSMFWPTQRIIMTHVFVIMFAFLYRSLLHLIYNTGPGKIVKTGVYKITAETHYEEPFKSEGGGGWWFFSTKHFFSEMSQTNFFFMICFIP